jgi:hypothetical protein
MEHAVVLDVNGKTQMERGAMLGVDSLSERPYKAALPQNTKMVEFGLMLFAACGAFS